MAAVTASAARGHRSLIGMVIAAVAARSRRRGKSAAFTAGVARVREALPTLAALSAANLSAFQVWHHGGWFMVCASLLVADWAVTGK
jgi:hypothetical protein